MVEKNNHPDSKMDGHECSFTTIQAIWLLTKTVGDHPNIETDADHTLFFHSSKVIYLMINKLQQKFQILIQNSSDET